jgi:tRNA1(Val) A37 N6-methylase TrmN6
MHRWVAVAFLLALSTVARADRPRSREDCAAAHPAAWGRAGKDAPWVPTFDAVILAMLSMAQVTPEDRVLDLGAGDGRIAITAAKPPFGARARGIEYDSELAQLAACLVEAEGVSERVKIVQGDIFRRTSATRAS